MNTKISGKPVITFPPSFFNHEPPRRSRASDSDSISHMTVFRKRNLAEFVRFAYVKRSLAIGPFPLSPFPFRDGGTKSENAIIKANFNQKRAKNSIFEDSAHI